MEPKHPMGATADDWLVRQPQGRWSKSMRRLSEAMLLLATLTLLAGGLRECWREASALTSVSAPWLRLVVALDGSSSMLAEDEPGVSRLDTARRLVERLLDAFPEAEVGLVSFGGEAMLEYPPSRDHEGLRVALAEVEPMLGFAPGSDPGEGLRLAEEMLGEAPGCVVLLTDGEVQALPSAPSRLSWRERRCPLAWCVLGLGEARPVPLGSSWLRDPETGMVAMSQAQDASLAQWVVESSAPQIRLASGMSERQMASALTELLSGQGEWQMQRRGEAELPWGVWSAMVGCVLLLASLCPWGRRDWRGAVCALLPRWGLVGCLLGALCCWGGELPDELGRVGLSPERRSRLLCEAAGACWREAAQRLSAEEVSEALTVSRRGLSLCREALRLCPEPMWCRQTLALLLAQEARCRAEVAAAEKRRAEAVAAANRADEARGEAPAQRRTELDDVLEMPGGASAAYGGASGDGRMEGVPEAPPERRAETKAGEVSGWGRLMRRERRLKTSPPGVKPW